MITIVGLGVARGDLTLGALEALTGGGQVLLRTARTPAADVLRERGVAFSSLDALYEEPREGELTGWICNDPEARSGAIKFTFKLGDRLYRVTRTRQKSGKATLNIAEYVEGEWVDRSKEKFKDTQQEIINIIGMDSLK